MSSPVSGQRLGQPAQDQVPVGFQDHVDEVDHHDAADVAQPKLADDLLSRLEVVLGHGLLEIAPGPGELAGVDVDDRHRLGAVDHQGAAGGQPDLAVHGFGELLVDPVHSEDVRAVTTRRFVFRELRQQLGRYTVDISGDRLPGRVAGDDEPGEVLVEQVADHLDEDVRLLVQGDRGARPLALDVLGLLGDRGPPLLQPGDVRANVIGLHPLGCGPDDHPRVGGHHLAQDLLESLALGVRQFAADTGRGGTGHINEVAPGQRDLSGQPCALVAYRILADLHHDVVARLESLLDLAIGPAEPGSFPVDLTGIEHTVAAAADIDERGLHRRQHVLHDAEVDVADQRRRTSRGHEVFDDDSVLEHGDLGVASALMRRIGADLVAHHHHPVHRLAAGQELGFGQDRGPAAAGVATVTATLTLSLQSGRSADALDLVGPIGLLPRGAFVDDGVGRVVDGGSIGSVFGPVARPTLATATTATTTGRTVGTALGVLAGFFAGLVSGVGLVALGLRTVGTIGLGRRVGFVVLALLPATSATTATSPSAATVRWALRAVSVPCAVFLILGVGRSRVVLVSVGLRIAVGLDHDRLGGDEQRHVGGRRGDRSAVLGSGFRGLQHRPRFRFRTGLDCRVGFHGGRSGFRTGRVGVRAGQQFADANGVRLVDAGMRAATAAVELAERVENPLAGGAEHTGQ